MKIIFDNIKNRKTLLILPPLLLICFISTISIAYSLLKISNIENFLRYIFSAFFIVFFIFIFLTVIKYLMRKEKKHKIIIFSILMVIIFTIESFGCYTINKVYNSIDNMNKNIVTYSTSLVGLKNSNITNIKDVKNLKIGVLKNKDSIDGYVIAYEIINENKLSKNNEIIKYESFASLLNGLYDKEVDLIFISSNYVTMFSSSNQTSEDGTNKYENIKDETVVITSKSKKIEKINSNVSSKIDKPFTVLVMGVDSTENNINSGSTFNGDALMLITFNPSTFNATILSIPRDTYVPISCLNNKQNKITHAAWYGESCMISTIENLTKINIDYYLKINFKGVVSLVDALGGININIPYAFCEQNSNREWGKNTIYLEAGSQTINGEEALAFARNRHPNPSMCSEKYTNYNSNDFIRGSNQQEILNSILNKVKNVSSLNKVYKILDVIGNNMDTSFSTNQILSFYNIIKEMLLHNKNKDIISFEHLYLSGYDKYIYDDSSKLLLYNFIYYEGSLDDIVDAMNINLENSKPTLIKKFDFSINKSYVKKSIGKGYYTVVNEILTLPKFIGGAKDIAVNYAANHNFKIDITYQDTNDKSKDNIVITQSLPYGYRIYSTSTLTITVWKYVDLSASIDENINNL